ncbi:MAG: DUF1146 domain-containing protein [Erysipelotrichaceae bacterium]|nr:DUF1146 domain-containing protein [Erysipelotrichaceae bacterium]
MLYAPLQLIIHLLCFAASFYALSAVRFERFCDVRKPVKIQVLLLLLSMGLGYLAAQLLLNVTVFNGL